MLPIICRASFWYPTRAHISFAIGGRLSTVSSISPAINSSPSPSSKQLSSFSPPSFGNAFSSCARNTFKFFSSFWRSNSACMSSKSWATRALRLSKLERIFSNSHSSPDSARGSITLSELAPRAMTVCTDVMSWPPSPSIWATSCCDPRASPWSALLSITSRGLSIRYLWDLAPWSSVWASSHLSVLLPSTMYMTPCTSWK
mmetsp:Transcript_2600/g.3815  ORF Transcript_2600/g.3815 Transcript_2600/m.3815 type:complete len:201 (-) Transcript_2600:34-636(-)